MSKTKKQVQKDGRVQTVVWGSPEHLKLKYDDVETVKELSRKTKTGAEIRRFVRTLSTPKDNLSVYRTYAVAGTDGSVTRKETVVWVSLGLNGTGRQSDYLAALKRLADTDRFYFFDACIDACDDVADVLCCYYPETMAVRFGETVASDKTCTGGCGKSCGKACGKACAGSRCGR